MSIELSTFIENDMINMKKTKQKSLANTRQHAREKKQQINKQIIK